MSRAGNNILHIGILSSASTLDADCLSLPHWTLADDTDLTYFIVFTPPRNCFLESVEKAQKIRSDEDVKREQHTAGDCEANHLPAGPGVVHAERRRAVVAQG